jgi:hypothetical protein
MVKCERGRNEYSIISNFWCNIMNDFKPHHMELITIEEGKDTNVYLKMIRYEE